MLRRFSSVSSFSSSFLRPSSLSAGSVDPPVPDEDETPDPSSLTEALSTSLIPVPSPPPPDPLTIANRTLIHALEALQIVQRAAYPERLALLAEVYLILSDMADSRNTFREHGGFLSAISVLASLDEASVVPLEGAAETTLKERRELRFELVKLVFQILTITFDGHEKNKADFKEAVGFDAVGEAIKLSGLMEDSPPSPEDHDEGADEGSPQERMMSILFSFLTADYASPPFFSHLRLQLANAVSVPPSPDPSSIAPSPNPNTSLQSSSSDSDADGAFSTPPNGSSHVADDTLTVPSPKPPPPLPPRSRTQQISRLIRTRFSALHCNSCAPAAENAEVIPLLLELQGALPESQRELRFMVVAAVLELVRERRSQVAVSEAGAVGIALERLVRRGASAKGKERLEPDMDKEERELWRELVVRLLEMGAGTKETRLLFQSVVEGWESGEGEERLNEEMLGLILTGVRESRLPSFVHFDLSRHGHSSINMRSLGRAFPPATHGYTFLAWVSIAVAPSVEDERLIVFGCGDATGKCHVEATITPDRHLALATALSKPPVVFASFTLEVGQFYHIALVHQRPKYSSNSPVSLYIDGKLVEVCKTVYPQAPPKDWEVQAWLGTPKDRVPPGRLGRGKSTLKWDLGPTWLIHGDVPEEMVYVCSTLGPRYASNFQDQLGQFQTNMSSTLLNVRLDAASKAPTYSAARQNTPLVYAIRDKGSAVIPEHRIIFAFSALNVLVSGSGRGISGSGLSEHAQHALALATASRGKVVVNSAIPRMEDALVLPHGLGFLGGDPCVANPKGLDVAIWKIGGVAVALRLVELATTGLQLAQSVQVFVELIKESWRNSEDTERVQGYEILGLLLRAKAGLITPETHDALFEFIGYDFDEPANSVVSNPLAFRFLALDFSLWSAAEPAIQWAHFDRLHEFVQRSVHREFNMRRMAKMHITRKLLYALRARYFPDNAMLGEVVETLMFVVRSHFTTETIRHIATFLAATLCQVQDATHVEAAAPALGESTLLANPATSFVLDASQVEQGSRRASLQVLAGLHDLLLSPDAAGELAKFGRVITAKWMLLFLLDKQGHPLAAVLALRILVRLLQTQGPAFTTKFTNSFDGFSLLRSAVPHLWNFSQIHLALFALLHGHDITTLPLDAPFGAATLSLSATEVSPLVAPDVVRIIIAAISRGLKVLSLAEGVEETAVAVPVVAVSAPAENEAIPVGGPPLSPHTLTLSAGFDALLDFLTQANRSVGASRQLVTAPTPLRDLTIALLQFLPLPTTPEYPPTANIPTLPTLSPASGFRLPPSTPPRTPVNGVPPSNGNLKLKIPTHVDVADAGPSPLSAIDKEGYPGVFPLITLSAAATSVVHFLGLLVAHPIMSRHVHRHTPSATQEIPEPSLAILHAMLSAAATVDSVQQVTFRTLLIEEVCRILARSSIMPAVATRVAAFAAFVTEFAFQGWNSDAKGLVDFVLVYLEKLLDEAGMGGDIVLVEPSDVLFRCLNRLVLLSLMDSERDTHGVIDLLVRHQLTIFAPRNTDGFFFRCFIQRLYTRLRAPVEDDKSATIDLFKLLILQRPDEFEAALSHQRRHASEVGVVDKLLDTDNQGFIFQLHEFDGRLEKLEESWCDFIEMEESRARLAVEIELSRLVDIVKASRHKRDAQRRRARKERASIYEWSEGIHDVESTRVAHTRQDIADLAVFVQNEWDEQHRNLRRECGIWGGAVTSRRWRLDFTEGYCRMRKKLHADDISRHQKTKDLLLTQATESHSRSLGQTRQDAFSGGPKQIQVDSGNSPLSPMTPDDELMWAGTTTSAGNNHLFSSSPRNSQSSHPDPAAAVMGAAPATFEADADAPIEEDKNRKVRRNLEPGDVIMSVFNISRIAGLNACPGLLLLAKKNVYIVDHFFQKANGELVDARDAPEDERDQHLQTLADLASGGGNSSTASPAFEAGHRTRRWTWNDLLTVHERKYLFRNVALELFFADGRSFLLTFALDQRALAYEQIGNACPTAVAFGSLNVTGASFGAKVTDAVLGHRTKLERMTKRWERREVSNFEYLMFLNTCAGRTYNDLTNYPVFPWVISDYTSDTLDLTKESTFRDLSKPMGAQNDERRKEFEDRYAQLLELDDGTIPFHYGTHYSSAMIVVGYLVRLRPFTESYLDLQGGSFDHADRMFWSVAKAWESSSKQSRSDVRELIPEFFFLPDFLRNTDSLDLGTRQEGNARIDNVELPPWAGNNSRRFVELNREALESEYVSTHLGSWIDLIFGCRQSGEAAIEACNVFHHLSYEGAIDLDKIEDVNERKAATSTIHSFGMTPRAIFSKPHPQRVNPLVAKATRPLFSPDLHIEQQTAALIQSIIPIANIDQQVATIYPSGPETTTATASQSLLIPGDPHHVLSWGYTDQTLRIHVKGNNLPVSLFENMHSEFISAAAFADNHTIATGSTDTTVSLWKWRWRSHGQDGHFQQLECLRGHSDQVSCIAASRAFSIIVSGSDDRTAIIWDLNRCRFVHRLEGHESRVHVVAISDTTGDIVTCSGALLRVWSVNGVLLASQSTSNFVDPITSVAFSVAETEPIIAAGHRNGRITLWKRAFSPSDATGWKLVLLQTLQHKDRLQHRAPSDVTALAFTPRTLYAGDATGNVWLWNPPVTELFLPDSVGGGVCLHCASRFGLMETRRRCSGCAGLFCSLCTTTSVEIGGRFCAPCFSKLSPLMVL